MLLSFVKRGITVKMYSSSNFDPSVHVMASVIIYSILVIEHKRHIKFEISISEPKGRLTQNWCRMNVDATASFWHQMPSWEHDHDTNHGKYQDLKSKTETLIWRDWNLNVTIVTICKLVTKLEHDTIEVIIFLSRQEWTSKNQETNGENSG